MRQNNAQESLKKKNAKAISSIILLIARETSKIKIYREKIKNQERASIVNSFFLHEEIVIVRQKKNGGKKRVQDISPECAAIKKILQQFCNLILSFVLSKKK
jgi:hypothetical protein